MIYTNEIRKSRGYLNTIVQITLITAASIIFLYVGIFVHEFFHLLMLIMVGIEEAEFYVGTNGGYVRYFWTNEITEEELLIVVMAGSLFTIILFLLITLCLYLKSKKFAVIPIMSIIHNIVYWYSGGADCQRYIKYNPTINFTYVNNLFLGLIILSYILMFVLIMMAVFNIKNEYYKI